MGQSTHLRPVVFRTLLTATILAVVGSGAAFAQGVGAGDQRKAFFEAKRAFEQAVKSKNLEQVIAGLETIGDLDSKQATEFLLGLDRTPSHQLYLALGEVLGRLSSPVALQTMLEAYQAAANSRGKNWQRQVLLIDAFGCQDSNEGTEALELAAKDPHPKVRLSAIRALAESPRPHKQRIQLLISSLQTSELARDTGTPHVEARRALAKLVGVDQPDFEAWSSYWLVNAAQFSPPDDEVGTPEIDYSGDVVYFGEAVISRRVLFVIDTSKSMFAVESEGWPDAPQEDQRVASGGGGGADKLGSIKSKAWNDWIDANPECVRIERAKGELSRLIKSLPDGAGFNVVAFHSKLKRWQPRLTPATAATRNDAVRFVDSLTPTGATAADLALAEAFQSNEVADTIYFLSDGHPSRDGVRYMDVEPLLRRVTLANRFRRIIIHALAFGTSGERFMKPLAEQNLGTYRQVVGPPQIQAVEEKRKAVR